MWLDNYIDQRIVFPFFDKHLCVGNALRRGFEIRGGEIKEHFADKTAHSRGFGRAGCFILENIHIAESGRAGFNHLGGG